MGPRYRAGICPGTWPMKARPRLCAAPVQYLVAIPSHLRTWSPDREHPSVMQTCSYEFIKCINEFMNKTSELISNRHQPSPHPSHANRAGQDPAQYGHNKSAITNNSHGSGQNRHPPPRHPTLGHLQPRGREGTSKSTAPFSPLRTLAMAK